MNKYFLHIGLHKTGTKFFQHKVFPNIPDTQIIFNPPKLTQLVCDLMKADKEDVDLVLDAINHEKELLQKEKDRTFVISREVMSGNLFSFYIDFEQGSARLKSAFDNAEIICFLRYQVDWIISCYRETIHEHHYQSVEEFLSFKEQKQKSFVRNNYKELDLTRIVKLLVERFGDNHVSFFFYEDFRENKGKVVEGISTLFDIPFINIKEDNDQVPNRGYSAFSIKLSIFRYKILTLFRLQSVFSHRPIWFFGSKGIPAGFESLSVLPKDKYWHRGFLRDNEEIRSKNYPKLSLIEKIKLELSWRSLIKKKIDKLIYWDWDILANYREEMDSYYHKKNIELLTYFDRNVLPTKYIK